MFISKFRIRLFVNSGLSDDFSHSIGTAVRLCSSEVLLLNFNVNCVHEHNCIANKACCVNEMVANLAACKKGYLALIKNY